MGLENAEHEIKYEEILTEEQLQVLEDEFSRLKNGTYLDHAGATLYARHQIDSIHAEMQSNLFSNPHSRNPSSSITTDAIDYIRLRILHHFGTNADDYSVVFTSGATSAMKLLAESFRFNGGIFCYLEESHTSVVGMRALVSSSFGGTGAGESGERRVGGCSRVYCLAKTTLEELMEPATGEEEDKCGSIDLNGSEPQPGKEAKPANSLMAFPAQCNFSGYKYPLEWIPRIKGGSCLAPIEKLDGEEGFTYLDSDFGKGLKKNGGAVETKEIKSNLRAGEWFCCLDAASFVATNALNLSLYPADFIPISFYKMFGFPTVVEKSLRWKT